MDLICFSHLRWGFVYQRPQHLLSRFANYFRVIYVEEPVFTKEKDGYHIYQSEDKVWIFTPHLQEDNGKEDNMYPRLQNLLQQWFTEFKIVNYFFWYYTPMALSFTSNFKPQLIIYDCMDELSAFKGAPSNISALEKKLMQKADLVFTGGASLYKVKSIHNNNTFCFPSSVDVNHFMRARLALNDPPDQKEIKHPRLGFFGVIDERFDIELIAEAALLKPGWQFILVGPVVKIDKDTLPKMENIHYMGMKSYKELPEYISNWDIALVPFAINESTTFISPTKTPEYLAAGKQVISTGINDIVEKYEHLNMIHFVKNAQELINAGESILEKQNDTGWLKRVDSLLSKETWNLTWHKMNEIIKNKLENKNLKTEKTKEYV